MGAVWETERHLWPESYLDLCLLVLYCWLCIVVCCVWPAPVVPWIDRYADAFLVVAETVYGKSF